MASSAAEGSLAARDPLWRIIADSFLTWGYTVWYTPHEPLAATFWGKALEIQRRELPSHHPDIATTVVLLVGVLNKAGKLEQSEALIRDSIDSLRSVYREGDLAIAIAEALLGETLAMQKHFDEAEPLLLKSTF